MGLDPIIDLRAMGELMPPATIAIVEDDAATRDRLCRIVRQQKTFRLSGAAATFSEARTFLGEHAPDVLLVDLGLPDGDGIDLIRLCHEADPSTLIMVISAFGDEQKVVSAIMAGAKGYLLKDDDSQDIRLALQQLLDGGSPISASIASYLLAKLRGDRPSGVAGEDLLTAREIEVLELIARGYRSQEIATRLTISYHTVVSHIRHVYDKLAVTSRSQAIFKASKLGLLSSGR